MDVHNPGLALCARQGRRQDEHHQIHKGGAMAEAHEDIWVGDTLERKADAEFLIDFLLGRIEQRGEQKLPRSYVLNVDAGWGGGKTFFMTRLAKELVQRNFAVAQIDAWQDDHAEDPLLSLMSAIETTINPLVRKHRALQSTYKSVKKAGLAIASAGIKGGLKQASRKLFGEAAEIIAEEIDALKDKLNEKGQEAVAASLDKTIDKSTENLLEGFEDGKKSISDFKSQMSNLIAKIRETNPNWTLFILIDELDRCRPTYAISLLERIKHLFNVDNVVFVISTDTVQLSHSVRAVYGGGFDGKKYLTRFFDRTYQFPSPSIERFVQAALSAVNIPPEKISLPPDTSLDQLLISSLHSFGATLREAKRSIETLSDISAAWSHPVAIECVVAIPLIAGYQTGTLDMLDRECFQNCLKRIVSSMTLSINFYSRSGSRDVLIGEIFECFVDNMTDIFKACSKENLEGHRHWVQKRFILEFGHLFKSTIAHGRIAPSIIRGYPQLIATAGRLQSGG